MERGDSPIAVALRCARDGICEIFSGKTQLELFTRFACTVKEQHCVVFLELVAAFKAGLMQPVRGPALELSAKIVADFLEDTGSSVLTSLSPSLRRSLLDRWHKMVSAGGSVPQRIRGNFFDAARKQVELHLTRDVLPRYEEWLLRLQREQRERYASAATLPTDSAQQAEVPRRRTTSDVGQRLAERKSAGAGLVKKITSPRGFHRNRGSGPLRRASSSSAARDNSSIGTAGATVLQSAIGSAAETPKLPLKVTIQYAVKVYPEREEHGKPYVAYGIDVVLFAASTELRWTVRRRFGDFKRLHHQLKRYKVVLPTLPTRSVFESDKDKRERKDRLEAYLHKIISIPQLQVSKELYAFLQINRTVDLLKEANERKEQHQAHRKHTIAVQSPEAAALVTRHHHRPNPEEKSLQLLGRQLSFIDEDALDIAMGNLRAISSDSVVLCSTSSPPPRNASPVIATKVRGATAAGEYADANSQQDSESESEGDAGVRTKDIAAALAHLTSLEFTAVPDNLADAMRSASVTETSESDSFLEGDDDEDDIVDDEVEDEEEESSETQYTPGTATAKRRQRTRRTAVAPLPQADPTTPLATQAEGGASLQEKVRDLQRIVKQQARELQTLHDVVDIIPQLMQRIEQLEQKAE